jgi:hypothetical protein
LRKNFYEGLLGTEKGTIREGEAGGGVEEKKGG